MRVINDDTERLIQPYLNQFLISHVKHKQKQDVGNSNNYIYFYELSTGQFNNT